MAIASARSLPIGAAVTVTGTITAAPGWILGDRVMSIQDGVAGLCIHLPSGVDLASFTRGRVVTVSGVLAAPYANLELRPAKVVRRSSSGHCGRSLTGHARRRGARRTHGRAARTPLGMLTRIETASSGSLALVLINEPGGAEARIFFFAPLGATRSDFAIGATYAATGIVGQRESASGLNDGYRLWPRRGRRRLTVRRQPKPAPPGNPHATANGNAAANRPAPRHPAAATSASDGDPASDHSQSRPTPSPSSPFH